MPRDRIKPRDLLPTVVKSRNLNDIVRFSSIGSVSTTLNNGDIGIFTSNITQNRRYELQGHLYLAFYAGSVNDDNKIPGGANVNEDEWDVIGPVFDYSDLSQAEFPKHREFITASIRNISAGNTTVNIRALWKYISPRDRSV